MTTTSPTQAADGATIIAVTRSAIVPLPPDRAFTLFTDGFATWWPSATFHLGADVPDTIAIERGVGGRWYERSHDGAECDWGEVLVWDPPHRLVLAWRIDADWHPDPTIDTEVEITFHAVDPTSTRVELEHRGLEAFGDRTDEMVGIFGSDHGWGGLVGRYSQAAHGSAAPVVEVERTVLATPADVWRALVDADVRAGWWAHLDLDARVGGRFEERWTDPEGRAVVTSGEVLESVPHDLLRLRWSDEGWPADTEVLIDLEPAGDGTQLRVRHVGWERLPDGRELAAAHHEGWSTHLANLDAVIAGPPAAG